MKIRKRLTDLKKGTIIIRIDGDIILNSDYDSFRDCYEYKNIEYNDNSEMLISEDGGYIKPVELIGCEYID